MGRNFRRELSVDRQKTGARLIAEFALERLENDSEKIGVLLCEGDENSIDKAVYSAIFPNLLVIPMCGCCSIMRVLNRLRRILAVNNYYAFGIIDRDSLSKSEIKKMVKEKGIYTTKLPFIENIICDANVLSYVCEDLGIDYEVAIEKIQEQLMKNLWKKFKDTLPINLGIEKNETIITLQIGASTKAKTIEKIVSKENIMYAYRSKIIVAIVATEMHMRSKEAYYTKIKEMLLDERYSSGLVKAMSKFVPKFEIYRLEDFQR